jgi:hypothetical protein
MKKILIISPVPTHPTSEGNQTCILSYSNMLREMGHDVYFLLIAEGGFRAAGENYAECCSHWGDKIFIYRKNFFGKIIVDNIFFRIHRTIFKYSGYHKLDACYPWGIGKYLKKMQNKNKFDAVIVNYVFLSRIFKHFRNVKKILYTHDVFTNKYQNTGQTWFSITPDNEAKALNRAEVILSIQENETIYYSYLTQRKILTVYSAFAIEATPLVTGRNIIYLSGTNSYNIEAITLFIEEVFPELEKVYPDIKLIIGGNICNTIKHVTKNRNNIILQGYISDISQFYSQADLCINPTYRGTGLKIKTFEALSFGKILVAHSHSITGIYEKEKAPIFCAETKDEYLKQFEYLFSNMDSWEKLKRDSLNYMQEFQDYVKSQFEKAIM